MGKARIEKTSPKNAWGLGSDETGGGGAVSNPPSRHCHLFSRSRASNYPAFQVFLGRSYYLIRGSTQSTSTIEMCRSIVLNRFDRRDKAARNVLGELNYEG